MKIYRRQTGALDTLKQSVPSTQPEPRTFMFRFGVIYDWKNIIIHVIIVQWFSVSVPSSNSCNMKTMAADANLQLRLSYQHRRLNKTEPKWRGSYFSLSWRAMFPQGPTYHVCLDISDPNNVARRQKQTCGKVWSCTCISTGRHISWKTNMLLFNYFEVDELIWRSIYVVCDLNVTKLEYSMLRVTLIRWKQAQLSCCKS